MNFPIPAGFPTPSTAVAVGQFQSASVTFAEYTTPGQTGKILFAFDGRVKSQVTPMTEATGINRQIDTHEQFCQYLDALSHNQAISLGAIDDRPTEQAFSIKAQGRAGPQDLTRTAAVIRWHRQAPAKMLALDIDTKDLPDHIVQRVNELGGLMQCLALLFPGLDQCKYVRNVSSSFGAHLAGHAPPNYPGDLYPSHLFYRVPAATDIDSLFDDAFKRAWCRGLGFFKLSSNGRRLERTIFDAVTSAPERLIYAGAPGLSDGIVRPPVPPIIGNVDGFDLFTPGGSDDISETEADQRRQAGFDAMANDAQTVVNDWIEKTVTLQCDQRPDTDPAVIRAEVTNRANDHGTKRELPEHWVLTDKRRDHFFTVADIFADPNRFRGSRCNCPYEGRNSAHIEACTILVADAQTITIYDHHDNVTYRLKPPLSSLGLGVAPGAAPAGMMITPPADMPGMVTTADGAGVRPETIDDLVPTLAADGDVEPLVNKLWEHHDTDGELNRIAPTIPHVIDRVREAVNLRRSEHKADKLNQTTPAPPMDMAGAKVAADFQTRINDEKAKVDEKSQSAALKASMMFGVQQVEAIRHFNSRYYIVDNHLGKAAVFDHWANDPSSYQSFKDFTESHAHRQVVTKVSKTGVAEPGNAATFWFQTREANRFDYSTFDMSQPVGEFFDHNGLRVRNFFQGWATQPVQGDWSHIYRYLFEFMCNNDHERFDYVLAYLSQMVVEPMNPPGIMIVWKSEETGTGKGTFYDLVNWMLGDAYTALVDDIDDVLGQWTDLLDRKVFIALDEAIVSGDPRAAAKLKATLTKPQLRINVKGEKQRMVPNLLRLAALTNDDWAANIDPNDRRTVVMEPQGWWENGVKMEAPAWGPYKAAMRGEVAAFMWHLLSIGVTRQTMPARLQTAEHAEQVERSLNGWRGALYQILKAGQIKPAGATPQWDAGWKAINKAGIDDTLRALGYRVPNSPYVPFKEITSRARTCTGTLTNVYPIPPLWEARRRFQAVTKIKNIDWEDDDPNSQWVEIVGM